MSEGGRKWRRGLIVPGGEHTKVGHGYSPAPPCSPGGLLDDVRSCCKVPQDFVFFLSFLCIFILFSAPRHILLFPSISALALFCCGHPPTAAPASLVCLDDFLQDAATQTFSHSLQPHWSNFLLFLILLSLSHTGL